MPTYKMISMEMVQYNKWQNETVFRLSDELDERELRLERRAFFGGLHVNGFYCARRATESR